MVVSSMLNSLLSCTVVVCLLCEALLTPVEMVVTFHPLVETLLSSGELSCVLDV